MPLHSFLCPSGHLTDRLQSLDGLREYEPCGECEKQAQKVFLKFPYATVQSDIHYESPIDGRVINSKHAREEDLARSDCVPYEPTLRAHSDRRAAQEDAALEARMEKTVEAEIHRMPAHKRDKLAAELEGGMTAGVERITPQQQSRSA